MLQDNVRDRSGTCDPLQHIVGYLWMDFSDIDFEPNIFIYDNFPGGIGLSPSLFDLETVLLDRCRKTIAACPCKEG